MAISQNFLTGRMRKSAGGTRFSTWRGLNIVAAKPISVRQNVTQAVQDNRDKMALVGKAIAKINVSVSRIYNFGISKTTPFADSVKFFRNKLLSATAVNPLLFGSAKFGTGNAEGHSYVVDATEHQAFSLVRSVIAEVFDTADTQIDLLVFNELLTKIAYIQNVDAGDADILIDLSNFGFVGGDKIMCGVKPIRFTPGNDLAGKVKMLDTGLFTTLT